jgi:hypothetical protein
MAQLRQTQLADFRASILENPAPVGTTCPRIFFKEDGESLQFATTRYAIWRFIETLQDESRVKEFAQGRRDTAAGNSWVRVRKGWHQPNKFHITVEMLWISEDPIRPQYVNSTLCPVKCRDY